jgi:hypothetical protein
LSAALQVVDDLDAVLDRFQRQTYRKALLFVDNAGADVLLGMLPFARELVKMGTQVGRGGTLLSACETVEHFMDSLSMGKQVRRGCAIHSKQWKTCVCLHYGGLCAAGHAAICA